MTLIEKLRKCYEEHEKIHNDVGYGLALVSNALIDAANHGEKYILLSDTLQKKVCYNRANMKKLLNSLTELGLKTKQMKYNRDGVDCTDYKVYWS